MGISLEKKLRDEIKKIQDDLSELRDNAEMSGSEIEEKFYGELNDKLDDFSDNSEEPLEDFDDFIRAKYNELRDEKVKGTDFRYKYLVALMKEINNMREWSLSASSDSTSVHGAETESPPPELETHSSDLQSEWKIAEEYFQKKTA